MSARRAKTLAVVGGWIVIAAVLFYLRLPSFGEAFFDPDVSATVYSAQLFAEGSCIYPDAVETKPPGSYAVVALLLALGRTATGFHIAAALYHLLCAVVLAAVARKAFGRPAGWFAALLYVTYSAGGFVNGLAPNFETWTILPIALAVLFALIHVENGRLDSILYAGLFSGAATLTKQQAVLVAVAIGFFLVVFRLRGSGDGRARRVATGLGAFTAGCVLPWIAVAVYFAAKGCLPDLIVAMDPRRAASYAALNELSSFFARTWLTTRMFAVFYWYLVAAAVAGLAASFRIARQGTTWLFVAWLVGATGAVAAGTRCYPHYYLFLVPVLAVLGGAFAAWLAARVQIRRKRIALACALVGLLIASQWREVRISGMSLRSVLSGGPAVSAEVLAYNVRAGHPWLRFASGLGAAEHSQIARVVGEYIRSHSLPDESLLVYDYIPSVYWFAQRKAPTRHHMNFEVACELPPEYGRWYRGDEQQLAANRAELLADLAARPPRYIVRWRYAGCEPRDCESAVRNPFYGGRMPIQPRKTPLFPELQAFVDAHYREPADALDLPLIILERDDSTFVPSPDASLLEGR